MKLHKLGVFLFLSIFITKTTAQETEQDSLSIRKKLVESGSFYVEAGSYGTRRETDPPDYIRNAAALGIAPESRMQWLNLGLDSRWRGEWRHNDIRRPESFSDDFPLLLRQRAYVGVIEALDPLRFAVEFEDARRNNGNYPIDNRDANKFEIIQSYTELYFKDALGEDELGNHRPLSIRYGRMAFEFLDRRLIGLNLWRNTTNNFTGLRIALGQDKNDWQLDALLVKPVNRNIERYDQTDKDRLFTSVIGHWRKYSEIITIEPYYMGLKQTPSPENNNQEREIHGLGLRLYGWINQSGFNYDLSGMFQFGKDDGLGQQAYALTTELGYTCLASPWKPRVSAFFGYASGDKDPNDLKSNRFERFFGFARPWSSDDYVVMENIVAPKLKIEFETKIHDIRFRVDSGYSFYWLASETDRFNNLLGGSSNNRDETGDSGRFLGHGLDFRARFDPVLYVSANVGYTHFTNGTFVKSRHQMATDESAASSDFIYVELTFNFLDLIKEQHNQ